MKNILISDEKGGILFYVGKVVTEGDLDSLEEILGRLFEKMQKLENQAPTPEGARLNILEHSHNTLWKAHVKAKKLLEEVEAQVASISRAFDLNRPAHMRMYRELDKQRALIDELVNTCIQDVEGKKRQDKRISDIEDFLGDI